MNKTIVKAPSVNLKQMKSFFIEMTAQNCNLKCKHCYIDFKEKKVKELKSPKKESQTKLLLNEIEELKKEIEIKKLKQEVDVLRKELSE